MNDNKIITFGCKINTYESEVMREKLAASKIENVIIINTCTVTKEAERQCLQTIRKLKRENPESKIIITGCAAQIAPQKFANLPEVFMVIGNIEKLKVDDLLVKLNSEKICVSDIMQNHAYDADFINYFDGRTRAFVQAQTGCDHRCTYCIVPYARGGNISISKDNVISQVKKLVANGFKEIVLVGIDIASYGMDLNNNFYLGNLVSEVLKSVPDLERLRLSSIDPKGFDETLISLIIKEKRLMPHFHLSIQSGDDMILKRMGRRHNSEDIKNLCAKLRLQRNDMMIGADVIVGFPTETDEMFENTCNLIKQCKISHLHVFPFSPRQGTPAAKMPMIKTNIIKERAKKLREIGSQIMSDNLEAMVNHECKVLCEKPSFGYCEHYLPVKINKQLEEGSVVKVKIKSYEKDMLIGDVYE